MKKSKHVIYYVYYGFIISTLDQINSRQVANYWKELYKNRSYRTSYKGFRKVEFILQKRNP